MQTKIDQLTEALTGRFDDHLRFMGTSSCSVSARPTQTSPNSIVASMS